MSISLCVTHIDENDRIVARRSDEIPGLILFHLGDDLSLAIHEAQAAELIFKLQACLPHEIEFIRLHRHVYISSGDVGADDDKECIRSQFGTGRWPL